MAWEKYVQDACQGKQGCIIYVLPTTTAKSPAMLAALWCLDSFLLLLPASCCFLLPAASCFCFHHTPSSFNDWPGPWKRLHAMSCRKPYPFVACWVTNRSQLDLSLSLQHQCRNCELLVGLSVAVIAAGSLMLLYLIKRLLRRAQPFLYADRGHK